MTQFLIAVVVYVSHSSAKFRMSFIRLLQKKPWNSVRQIGDYFAYKLYVQWTFPLLHEI